MKKGSLIFLSVFVIVAVLSASLVANADEAVAEVYPMSESVVNSCAEGDGECVELFADAASFLLASTILPDGNGRYSISCNSADLGGVTINNGDQFVITVLKGRLDRFPATLNQSDITYIDQAAASGGTISFLNFTPSTIPNSTVFISGGTLAAPVIVGYLEANGFEVTGSIKYQTSNTLATVMLYDKNGSLIDTANTDIFGAFTLFASEGTYTLKIEKPGYLSYTINELALSEATSLKQVDISTLAGDVNGDGWVNSVDLTAFLSEFGTAATTYPNADIDGNGSVNSVDLTCLLAGFGKSKVVVNYADL